MAIERPSSGHRRRLVDWSKSGNHGLIDRLAHDVAVVVTTVVIVDVVIVVAETDAWRFDEAPATTKKVLAS